tara:strand:- start:28638 stop:28748 length:111 start_codon:yes stop_codon:yes gene_type:complete
MINKSEENKILLFSDEYNFAKFDEKIIKNEIPINVK